MTVAYQLEEAGTRLRKTTIERRPLSPRDVRLDLKYCGICHSDLSMINNKIDDGENNIKTPIDSPLINFNIFII